jgi:beta-lactamase regulating signal transducer with metallopeptidase domain
MTLLAPWLAPSTMRLLALALLHFLWQGVALGALAYMVMALCRNASARYAVGVGALALMLAAPVCTFLVFRAQEQGTSPGISADAALLRAAPSSTPMVTSAKPIPNRQESGSAYLLWLVELWFAGVVLLSLRSAGGFLLVESLRRGETVPVTEQLLELCVSLQRRMGLTRAVRYCQSIHLDAPAVAGWMRPVVLLPMSALTGLTTAQLEAVIAHELAHIQRFDAFVNLFQVAVETLLFYHPAVWWLGKRIRGERENCCDDAAVALCGSPDTYAYALTRMAESKAAPQLAMAANRGPLVERIARLLGANTAAESYRGANFSAGVLCLSAALLAGSALMGSVHNVHAQRPAPVLAPAPAAVPVVSPVHPGHEPTLDELIRLKTQRVTAEYVKAMLNLGVKKVVETAMVIRQNDPAPSPAPVPAQESSAPAASQAASAAPKQSYIDSLKEVGLTDLTADELIGLKVQGVTAEYVKAMKDLGMKLDADQLIGIKVQGITPEYIREMRAATGQTLGGDELIGMKVQGVTPEYVKQMHDLGLKTEADEIIGMKVQGITPDYVRELRGLGMKIDSDEIIGMKVQGVTPEYVKSIQALGLHPDSDEIIGMKVQGITPDYLKELQAAGFKVDIDEAISAKVQGITPEFIARARSHGFKDLTLEKLIALKHAGVLDAEK